MPLTRNPVNKIWHPPRENRIQDSKNVLDDLAWAEMMIVRHLRNEKAAGAEMRSAIDLFAVFFPSTFDMES